MRISTLFFLCLIISLSIQAQDGLKIKLGGSDAFHIHENTNGSYMFEVFENNTFFGQDAGLSNEMISTLGRHNSFFGNLAGINNSDGSYNTLVGSEAGEDNTTGKYLTLLGYRSGGRNITGEYNTSIGSHSNYYNTAGSFNTSLGNYANYYNYGNRNTIIGYQAGRGSTFHDSDDNVFIGYQAGYYETEDDRLYIDNTSTSEPLIYGIFDENELKINGDLTIDVPVGSNETRAEIKFGYENTVAYTIDYDGSNDKFEIREGTDQIMIITGGNIGVKRTPTTNDLEVNGTASKSSAGDWLANSDARLKKNITPLNSSFVLSKLLQLQGITYEWNDKRESYDRPEGEQYGFTAQNIEKVFPELVSTDEEGYLQTSYGTYDAMYIEAIRALYEKIEVLEQRINEMENSPKLED